MISGENRVWSNCGVECSCCNATLVVHVSSHLDVAIDTPVGSPAVCVCACTRTCMWRVHVCSGGFSDSKPRNQVVVHVNMHALEAY